MIFSILLRRLLLLLLFAVVSLSPENAKAQCPQGKPPNSDGTCGKPHKNKAPEPTTAPPQKTRPQPPRQYNNASVERARNDNSSNSCMISVRVIKQTGEPLAAVNLMLDDSVLNIGVTDVTGTYQFQNLACNRDYKITPGRSGFTFNRAAFTITNLTKNEPAVFIASEREKVAPVNEKIVSKEETRPCNPPPTYLPKIKIGDTLTGKLSPKISFCDEKTKRYFNSYQLDGALGGDIIQFDLQTDPASDLVIQVIGKTGDISELLAEGESDNASARQLVLPTAGDYTLRVIDKSNRSSEYRLNMTRKGLSDDGYRAQLDRAYAALADPDKQPFYGSLNRHIERFRPFSDGKASEQKINEATAVLDRLRELSPNKPEAYSLLAAINLYYRKDLGAGRELATKALELGGEARFRVNFGEKLDKDLRRVTDSSSCWLIVRKDKVTCESFNPNEGELFTTTPQWIAKKSMDVGNFYLGLTISGRGKGTKVEKRELEADDSWSYYFVPLSVLDQNTRFSLSEVAMIKNLIKQFAETPHLLR
jgi:hypothetical protein